MKRVKRKEIVDTFDKLGDLISRLWQELADQRDENSTIVTVNPREKKMSLHAADYKAAAATSWAFVIAHWQVFGIIGAVIALLLIGRFVL